MLPTQHPNHPLHIVRQINRPYIFFFFYFCFHFLAFKVTL